MVWGCQCFALIPDEIHVKGGFKHFEAVFVGYEENQIGWKVQDLQGKYHFSQNVIFNENVQGHLSCCSLPSPSSPPHIPSPSSPHPQHNQLLTEHGQQFADAIHLWDEDLAQWKALCLGGVSHLTLEPHPQQSLAAVEDFIALLTLGDFPIKTESLADKEQGILLEQHVCSPSPIPCTSQRWPISINLQTTCMMQTAILTSRYGRKWCHVNTLVFKNMAYSNPWSWCYLYLCLALGVDYSPVWPSGPFHFHRWWYCLGCTCSHSTSGDNVVMGIHGYGYGFWISIPVQHCTPNHRFMGIQSTILKWVLPCLQWLYTWCKSI